MTRHSLVRIAPALIVAVFALDGCSWFRHQENTDYYKNAREANPLEVPPDLDTPPDARELVVPAETAGAKAAAATTAPAAVDGFHLADTVDNAYQRVGLALDKAELGKVAARNDSAHSFDYAFDGTVDAGQPAQKSGGISRLWRFITDRGDDASAKPDKVSATLHVDVREDAGGARISVGSSASDAQSAAAARKLLKTLRDRLS